MFQKTRPLIIFLLAAAIFCFSAAAFGAELELAAPVAITTCGQSPGALMAKLIFTKAGLENYHDDLLDAEYLKEQAAQNKGFKTLVITTGTSMKGMGAAGTDINVEIARIEKLIAEAKKQGIVVIGAHIEGMGRRMDHTDKLSIETVCQEADLLMVIDDSDSDGYFTELAAKMEVPLLKVAQALNFVDDLQELFTK
ncbi:MAG TPA: hypothetical protein GX528_07440 [Firmicutes bacterium]|nr:hypothetical protein [Bacillota bacterium]